MKNIGTQLAFQVMENNSNKIMSRNVSLLKSEMNLVQEVDELKDKLKSIINKFERGEISEESAKDEINKIEKE